MLFKLDKSELMIDPDTKQKKKNRVKFAANSEVDTEGLGSRKKKDKTRRLSDLKQSFESMNRSFKDSLVCDSFPNDSEVGDLETEDDEGSGTDFNYEDYLDEDEFDSNQTLEYQDLLNRLSK